ncbi:MAG: 1,6-anhydro-N-acetylmuramyl-L-alanine amidase AmpD [Panacagrimonas sp.]
MRSSSAWHVDDTHRLRPTVRELASPHYDARPDPDDISLVVIHSISLPPGQFGGHWIDDLFLGRLDANAHPYFRDIAALRVSSHLCVFRDGAVTQYVPFDQRAWHAGVSQWQGRERCNDFSIGIELEGSDDQAFAPAQYYSLVRILRALFARYPRLGSRKMAGHSDIAPGRKTDPGPHFDWSHLHALLAAA